MASPSTPSGSSRHSSSSRRHVTSPPSTPAAKERPSPSSRTKQSSTATDQLHTTPTSTTVVIDAEEGVIQTSATTTSSYNPMLDALEQERAVSSQLRMQLLTVEDTCRQLRLEIERVSESLSFHFVLYCFALHFFLSTLFHSILFSPPLFSFFDHLTLLLFFHPLLYSFIFSCS